MEDRILDKIDLYITLVNKSGVPFWDTQWFSALIGASFAILFTWLKDLLTKRAGRLAQLYEYIVSSGHFIDPESLLSKALVTSYGNKTYQGGVETVHLEKTIAEKMIIELRKSCKYWRFPFSKIRYRLKKYEQSLKFIPQMNRSEVITSKHFIKSKIFFNNILEFSYKKTGENQWTVN